jgi:hypothetical protein
MFEMLLFFLIIFVVCNNNYSMIMLGKNCYKISNTQLHMATTTTTNDLLIERQSGIFGLIDNFKKPAHIGIPRKEIYLQFAVQLMRQSYNVVDDLDFVPMDEFQRTFFLFRQNEWEQYKQYHQNVMQGALSDPVYFDFISYAQYAVISDKMKNGKLEFVEKVNATGDTQIVRRNPLYSDNNILPNIHSKIVGDKILEYLIDSYQNNSKLLPPLLKTNENLVSYQDLSNYMQMILDLFLINNYALSASIIQLPSKDISDGELLYQIIIRLPINLWSHQALINRNDQPVNNFEIKVLQSLVERYNYTLDLISTSFTNKIDVNYVVKLRKKKDITI